MSPEIMFRDQYNLIMKNSGITKIFLLRNLLLIILLWKISCYLKNLLSMVSKAELLHIRILLNEILYRISPLI